MHEWEHLRQAAATEEELDSKLSQWGSLGWELVTVLHDNVTTTIGIGDDISTRWLIFFRRPKPLAS